MHMEEMQMVQLTCIYTRGGDKGKTSLGSGKRVLKSALRIQAIGDIDEANSHLGCVLASLPAEHLLVSELKQIQNDLFNVGADLCMPATENVSKLTVGSTRAEDLERNIDRMNQDLPPLKSFILPGGTPAASLLFLARAVVRKAEREVVALSEQESISPPILQYLNRLSDYLFVAARWENQRAAVAEILWVPGN